MSVLRGTFHEHSIARVPYLFVYIGNGFHSVSAEQEREVLTFLKHMEQYLIDRGAIKAVGFRYLGGL
jgi:hypothetical protein